jgi:hypothetical protein
MNTTRKRATFVTLAAIIAATTFATTSALAKSALTLENIKNGSYQFPNSACGYTIVQLHDGKGANKEVNVVFGRATFGKLTNKQEPGAVVHLAYKDDMFGWQQQVVFLVERNGKVLQIGELGLDERDQVKNVELRDGNALIETSAPDVASGKVYKKCLKAELVERKDGCQLTATKYNWLTTEKDQDAAERLVSLR